MGLKPDYRIKANDQDITGKIQSRLFSLRLVDEDGLESDTLEIVLADHDPNDAIQLPTTGAELEVSIGYDGDARTMGLFVVDELELSGPPRKMRIAAHASPHEDTPSGLQALQTQRSRSWDEATTIGEIVRKCANDCGMAAAVDEVLASIALPHIDQTNESDINLLTRIARDQDAIAKPGGGNLLMVKRGQGKTAGGNTLDSGTIRPENVTAWSVLDTKRAPSKTVIAAYRDTSKAKDVEVVVGEGEPVRRLPHTYSQRSSARRAAQAELDQSDRSGKTLRVTMPGRTDVLAGALLQTTDFRDGADGQWVITRVMHNIDRNGYVCRVDAESSDDAPA